MQVAHHLAAVAHAERERVAAGEERGELVAGPRVEQDRLGPALAGAQHVAVGKPAAGDEPPEVGERPAAREDVGHVHVGDREAGAVEGRRHLDLAVDALLAQDRDRRARPRRDERSGDVLGRIEGEDRREPRVGGIGDPRVFLVDDVGIVAQPLQLVRRRRPRAVQIDARLVEQRRAAGGDA